MEQMQNKHDHNHDYEPHTKLIKISNKPIWNTLSNGVVAWRDEERVDREIPSIVREPQVQTIAPEPC